MLASPASAVLWRALLGACNVCSPLRYSATHPLIPLLLCLPQVRAALAKVPAEVQDKYYGCGSPFPMGIHGLR